MNDVVFNLPLWYPDHSFRLYLTVNNDFLRYQEYFYFVMIAERPNQKVYEGINGIVKHGL